MTDPVNRWTDTERQEREAILCQLEEEARSAEALPEPGKSIFETLRLPLELTFATVLGVLCGLFSVLAVVVLKVIFG